VLADLGGRPMLFHVWHRVVATALFDRVWVATSDPEVEAAARGFGADVVVTPEARNGTHRVALAVGDDRESLVVNVQGDQPFVDPEHLRILVDRLEAGAPVATLAAPLDGDADDPARVKVDLGPPARFSRRPFGGPPWVHLGTYGFGPGVVARCAAAPPSESSRREDLEQLAWLDSGIDLVVAPVRRATLSVDTPADLERARDGL
jgi:3-deoxy-manno-octulosonate cytidylyltransferase (CMP-KDO synthetase)